MEMLVVIAIIGLLVGAIAVGVRGHLARSRISIAKMEISKIVEALESFSSFKTQYPTQEEGLQALVGDGNAEEQFLQSDDFKDPWGMEYEYLVPGSSGEPFEIVSSGPDRQFETEDDISNITMREN